MKKVAVFCGSSIGFNEVYRNEAIKLGNHFIENNIGLVYGGGKIGMMGILADTMIEKNGEVIGVIPGLLRHEEVAHTNITEMIVTKTMSKRKIKISKLVDGYIALPGGFGTMDEIFEALTLGQLGIETKPVGILNTNGFFNHLILQLDVMVTEGYLKQSNKEMLIISDSVTDLIAQMFNYKAPEMTKVIHKIVK
ncbi:MAG: TIGR00730 family Rossman fold protein [Lutibacter sp.]|nr:TIGR00730 family Rossman fold protein [Lutibacter sp.]